MKILNEEIKAIIATSVATFSLTIQTPKKFSLSTTKNLGFGFSLVVILIKMRT